MLSNTIKLVRSYLTGILVETQASAISDELEVWFQNGRYVLHSSRANYSYHTLHQVFRRAFKAVRLQDKSIHNVLVLGFGGGSIAHILVHEMNLKPFITGVEADEAVIQLAKKYFPVLQYPRLNLVKGDAAAFVSSCTQTFDLVISDVFIHTHVPQEAASWPYIQRLVQLTAPHGTGMINFITETPVQQKQLHRLTGIIGSTGVQLMKVKPTEVNTVLVWHKPVDVCEGGS